jgi:creatinine amidohydrolase
LTKIVVVNCHGGNTGLLSFFNMPQLQSERDYVVYVAGPLSVIFTGGVKTPWELSTEGDAGPGETSMIQVARPDLVDMERVPTAAEGRARNHLNGLKDAGVQTGISWYSDYPTHYMGDASSATPEAGERLPKAAAQNSLTRYERSRTTP